MGNVLIYSAGSTTAVRYACQFLANKGIGLTASPGPDVTHLLLPVPSFQADGRIRGGGILENVLGDLPSDITVIGGNLHHPALEGYRGIDLLRDGLYTAKNAAITAECAIRVAADQLPVVWESCPVLITGWGRIGKCLAATLKTLGADVTVAARKETDRQMLQALGYAVEDPKTMLITPADYRVIFNTAPAIVIDEEKAKKCGSSIKIELASLPGIAGSDVIKALGLPGKMVPETSGQLIADTIIKLLKGAEE